MSVCLGGSRAARLARARGRKVGAFSGSVREAHLDALSPRSLCVPLFALHGGLRRSPEMTRVCSRERVQ